MDVKDLAGFSEPTGKAIDAIRAACGKLFEPTAIRRKAKAEADANVSLAKGEARVDAIRARTRHRLEQDEARRQVVIESIAARADRHLPAELPDKHVEPDWVFHFLNEAKDTTNEEMQELWARLLAGELGSPGSFSKRTVTFIKLLEPADAAAFTKLCQLTLNNDLLIVDLDRDFFDASLGLSFEALDHLDAIGLIHYATASHYRRSAKLEKATHWRLKYFAKVIVLDFSKEPPDDKGFSSFNAGSVILTRQGSELAKLVERRPDDAALEYMLNALKALNPGLGVTAA